jgi:hypothetical protein
MRDHEDARLWPHGNGALRKGGDAEAFTCACWEHDQRIPDLMLKVIENLIDCARLIWAKG